MCWAKSSTAASEAQHRVHRKAVEMGTQNPAHQSCSSATIPCRRPISVAAVTLQHTRMKGGYPSVTRAHLVIAACLVTSSFRCDRTVSCVAWDLTQGDPAAVPLSCCCCETSGSSVVSGCCCHCCETSGSSVVSGWCCHCCETSGLSVVSG